MEHKHNWPINSARKECAMNSIFQDAIVTAHRNESNISWNEKETVGPANYPITCFCCCISAKNKTPAPAPLLPPPLFLFLFVDLCALHRGGNMAIPIPNDPDFPHIYKLTNWPLNQNWI